MQLNEEMNKQEECMDAYLEISEAKKDLMLESIWKLNVADIEMTLSHVCQKVHKFSKSLITYTSSQVRLI